MRPPQMSHKLQRVLLYCIGILCLIPINAYCQNNTNVAIEDGTWCWYADPRAVYHKGKKEKIYFGYINSKGDVRISSRELPSAKTETFILHDKLQVDDHNVPSILFLPDGKILTFYTEHNGKFFLRKSKYAEDISAWEEERELNFGLNNELITYSHPVMLSHEHNRIYVFFRSRNKRDPANPKYTNWKQHYVYSDDLGKTWTDAKPFLDSKGSYDRIPYLKVVSDHKSKIHFLFTNGHPKLDTASVFHMYLEKDKFYQTDGSFITAMDGRPVDISKVHKLYDANQYQVKSWIWDIALDKQGFPVVTYARYPTINDHIYHYAAWDGKAWKDTKLINSGKQITSPEKDGKILEEHYSGGVVLDHNDPSRVFLARQVGKLFEIEEWKLNKGKWETSALTSKSQSSNVRPYVVDQYSGNKPFVMWMNGRYDHYTRYLTNLMINR